MSDNPPVPPGTMLLELVPVPVPVTDIEKAKAFYQDQLGFRLDVDVNPREGIRIVQLTPPGSACSITLAEGLPTLDMPAGTLRGLHLVVADIEAARADLVGRGVEVNEVENSLFTADAGSFAALGGQHVGMAGMSVAPARAGAGQ